MPGPIEIEEDVKKLLDQTAMQAGSSVMKNVLSTAKIHFDAISEIFSSLPDSGREAIRQFAADGSNPVVLAANGSGIVGEMLEAVIAQEPRPEHPGLLYGYYVKKDGPEGFYADVRDENGNTVFVVKAGSELGENETSLVDDGFMLHVRDMENLGQYLKTMHIIPGDAEILDRLFFEERIEEAEGQGQGLR